MLLNRHNLTDDEYKQLLKEHQREMEALNQNLEAEKDRQKRIIADKVRVLLLSDSNCKQKQMHAQFLCFTDYNTINEQYKVAALIFKI